MMGRILVSAATVFGPTVTRWAAVAVAIGALALVVSCLPAGASVTLGALASAWLFFAGLAAGGVALSAVIRLSRGHWAGAARPWAEATIGFFPVAIALQAILVLAAPAWDPSAAARVPAEWAVRCARDLGTTAILFGAGAFYVKRSRGGGESSITATRAGIVYLLLYVATLSVWAVDLVMDLRPWAPSTVIPAFYFMGAFLGAIAWTTLAASLRDPAACAAGVRYDLGKLLFAFVILWGYLLWSAYLPVWYGNMADETGQLLARWSGGWRFVSLPVLGSVLAFPFVFLLPEKTKKGRITVAVAAASILAGLLCEHFLLVLPSLPIRSAWLALLSGAGATAGVSGLFILAVGCRMGAWRTSTGPESR